MNVKLKKADRIRRLSGELFLAWQTGNTVEPFTKENDDLSLEDAYAIQRDMLERLKEAGYHPSGHKLGYTNLQMQQKMGLLEPSYGILLTERRYKSGADVPAEQFLQPGMETELLFVPAVDLNHGPYTLKSLQEAVAEVHAAMEIVDMRQNRQGKTQRDSVGDLGAFGGYVVGERNVLPVWKDFSGLQAELFQNEESVAAGDGTAVMGNPWNALLWLANRLHATADYLRAGEEIMTGSFTPLMAAKRGDRFRAVFGGAETVEIRFV